MSGPVAAGRLAAGRSCGAPAAARKTVSVSVVEAKGVLEGLVLQVEKGKDWFWEFGLVV